MLELELFLRCNFFGVRFKVKVEKMLLACVNLESTALPSVAFWLMMCRISGAGKLKTAGRM